MPKTLVIQPLPGIGDTVWHLPHLKALANRVNAGRITLATKAGARAEEILASSGLVEEVMVLERAARGEPAGRHDGLGGVFALAGDLKARQFDEVWVLHESARYALAACLGGIPKRIGFGGRVQRLWLRGGAGSPLAGQKRHTTEKATALLNANGIAVDPAPRLSLGEDVQAGSAERIAKLSGPVLALIIGSSEASKQWGGPNYSEIAKRWQSSQGGSVLVIGGPGESELAQNIRQSCNGVTELVLGEPLLTAASLSAQADVIVGNDTGLLNLAAAVVDSRKIIGLFGNSPALTMFETLKPLVGEHRDLANLTSDQVWTEIEALSSN